MVFSSAKTRADSKLAQGDDLWQGELGEILAFSGALSPSETAKIEGYLARKWGLTLPSSHASPGKKATSSNRVCLSDKQSYGVQTTWLHRPPCIRGTSNSGGSTWSDAFSFTTGSVPNPPALSVSTPTVVGNTTATTKGHLLSFDGTTNPTITLYYGTSDGNQTPSNWNISSPVSLSTKPVGPLDHNLTGPTAGTTYYYRYFATVTISGTAYSTSRT